MKNLKRYVQNHEHLEVVTESSLYPLPKLSTTLETTNTLATEPTSMSSFLEKLQREQLYRKHQFQRFRQMALQTAASSNSSTILLHEDETNDEKSSMYDIDITEMPARRTHVTAAETSIYKNDVDASALPLTTQMKQRWDVLLLNHRKKNRTTIELLKDTM